jgi:hypothetical protein
VRRGYVGFSAGFTLCRTSTQPTNIKQLPKYGFNEQNPTNHATGVSVQALSRLFYKAIMYEPKLKKQTLIYNLKMHIMCFMRDWSNQKQQNFLSRF